MYTHTHIYILCMYCYISWLPWLPSPPWPPDCPHRPGRLGAHGPADSPSGKRDSIHHHLLEATF